MKGVDESFRGTLVSVDGRRGAVVGLRDERGDSSGEGRVSVFVVIVVVVVVTDGAPMGRFENCCGEADVTVAVGKKV